MERDNYTLENRYLNRVLSINLKYEAKFRELFLSDMFENQNSYWNRS